MTGRAGRPRWGPRLLLAGVVLIVVGEGVRRLPAGVPGRGYWLWLTAVGVAVLTVVVGVWRHRRGGSSGLVHRWSRRGRRNDGVASAFAIWRGRREMRRNAVVLRPSLARLSWWRRRLLSTAEVGTRLARVGWQWVWSAVEDVTVMFGGPRTGKTVELAGRILDARGAVIATSTRTDLVEWTSELREMRRGPVGVFNPSGVGDLPSTIVFDPLAGCAHPPAATARATDMLGAVDAPGAGGDREYWASQARRVLACLLHAAALGGYAMRDVLDWVSDPDAANAEVLRQLRTSPQPAYESDAAQFFTTNDRTRSSISSTIMPALGWLTDDTAVAATTPTGDGDGSFDVARLLGERGTVHLLGAEDAQVAPLVAALTGHIAREARRIARTMPGGRLDPPLTLALDEAALICPVPLDKWTADMGGHNITIFISAQSRAQLRQRYGPDGAAAILNNAATVLVFGGTRDPADLAAFEALAGEREEQLPTLDAAGHVTGSSTQRVPVLTKAQIAQIPKSHVLIIQRGMAPAVGRSERAWKRRDVIALRRAKRWQRYTRTAHATADRLGDWLASAGKQVQAKRAEFAAARQAVRGDDSDRWWRS